MRLDEAEIVSGLIADVVLPLDYYSQEARSAEIAKYTPELLRAASNEDSHSAIIARDSSRPVGFCISHLDDGLIWLAWFGVLRSHRQRGIGRALLDALESSARNRRSHKIWCDCRTSNQESKVVLSGAGFVQICTVRNHWYGHDFILWEKLIA